MAVLSVGRIDEGSVESQSSVLQSLLKSKRLEQHFISEAKPFTEKVQSTFEEVLNAPQELHPNLIESHTYFVERHPEHSEGSPACSTVLNCLEDRKSSVQKDTLRTQDDFVAALWPKAKAAALELGLDPKLLLAQVALETGWGKFIARDKDGSSSNNLFNIKATKPQSDSVSIQTTEYTAGIPAKTQATFKKYPSVKESFTDYVSLIKNNDRYKQAVSNAQNPESYLKELHKAGYATDPEYANKIAAIYHGKELNRALAESGVSEML